MSSRRQLLLKAFETQLAAIVAGETAPLGDTFETDAGRSLFRGDVPQLGPDDPDQVIAIMPRQDEPRAIGRVAFQVVLPIDVHAVVKVDLDDPWTVAEQVVADIKRAIETEDQGFDGLLQDLVREGVSVHPRDPGSTVVAITVPYLCTFLEQWGRP